MVDLVGYFGAPKFTAVAKVEENLLFLPEKRYYKVTYIEQLPAIVQDFGKIAAGDVLEKKPIGRNGPLEMPENNLLQFRFFPLDDIEIRVFQPRSTARFETLRAVGWIGRDILQYNPELNLTELFQFEARGLYFDIRNPAREETPTSRIKFFGWRMQVEPIPPPPKWIAIPVGAKGD